jgi:non-canonical (house-cleaning) NTP pyrophosphatase
MKFVVGSASKRKIEVTEKIVKQLFREKDVFVAGYSAASNVPETPYDKQTFDGAKNRAADSRVHIKDAEFYIGLESGLVERYGHIYEEAWAVIIAGDNREYYGYSSGLKVPDLILQKMDELKIEHCDVMSILEREHGKLPNDTWSNYSGGMIIREVSLEEALRNALIQIVATEESFYKKNG